MDYSITSWLRTQVVSNSHKPADALLCKRHLRCFALPAMIVALCVCVLFFGVPVCVLGCKVYVFVFSGACVCACVFLLPLSRYVVRKFMCSGLRVSVHIIGDYLRLERPVGTVSFEA